jgi:hypothetical protein
MEGELSAALERLSAEEAFRLVFGAYGHLARLGEDVRSTTRDVLRRLAAGEAATVLACWKKVLEEQDEVRLVLAGRHAHVGQTPRQTLVNELQQLVYWSCLPAVARGLDANAVRFTDFLTAGLTGREPTKGDYDDGGSELAILRRALAAVGRAVAAFDNSHPDAAPVEVREVALADLRQMAGREYLADYLRAAMSSAGR